jgi:hypothetical protein
VELAHILPNPSLITKPAKIADMICIMKCVLLRRATIEKFNVSENIKLGW